MEGNLIQSVQNDTSYAILNNDMQFYRNTFQMLQLSIIISNNHVSSLSCGTRTAGQTLRYRRWGVRCFCVCTPARLRIVLATLVSDTLIQTGGLSLTLMIT